MEMANSAPTDTSASAPVASPALPLERKLPLLILGVLAFVLALSLGISYFAVRRSALVSTSERLSSLSHVLASMVSQNIGVRLQTMSRVAGDSAIVSALRTPQRA